MVVLANAASDGREIARCTLFHAGSSTAVQRRRRVDVAGCSKVWLWSSRVHGARSWRHVADGPSRLGLRDAVFDEHLAVLGLGGSSIVSSAEEADVLRRSITPAAVGVMVVVLEPGARVATGAVGSSPGAAQVISFGDVTASGAGDVA